MQPGAVQVPPGCPGAPGLQWTLPRSISRARRRVVRVLYDNGLHLRNLGIPRLLKARWRWTRLPQLVPQPSTLSLSIPQRHRTAAALQTLGDTILPCRTFTQDLGDPRPPQRALHTWSSRGCGAGAYLRVVRPSTLRGSRWPRPAWRAPGTRVRVLWTILKVLRAFFLRSELANTPGSGPKLARLDLSPLARPQRPPSQFCDNASFQLPQIASTSTGQH